MLCALLALHVQLCSQNFPKWERRCLPLLAGVEMGEILRFYSLAFLSISFAVLIIVEIALSLGTLVTAVPLSICGRQRCLFPLTPPDNPLTPSPMQDSCYLCYYYLLESGGRMLFLHPNLPVILPKQALRYRVKQGIWLDS